MNVTDLLEAKEIKERDIERLKLEKTVYEESGTNPVIISVVMPTFNNNSQLYIETLQSILKKMGELIDAGAIDELVIVDGSRDKDGNTDFEFIRYMLALCIKYCRIFSNEVNFVKSMPEGKQRSMQGRFDFSIRFMSQLDPLLHKIFLDRNILTQAEIDSLKRGKGGGLWFSVPVTYGHIVCFFDSDIRSFENYYVTSLCKPILDSWNSDSKSHTCNPEIVFSKAVYTRKTETPEGMTLGGRLSRICALPTFRSLAKMGIFKGLEEIEYPMSGECAFSIDALKDIQFSNGYDIETSVLCQVWKKFGMGRMAQVDFGLYQHIPGGEEHVRDMMADFISALKYWSEEYGIHINPKKLAEIYENEGYKMFVERSERAARMGGIDYGDKEKSADEKRLKDFLVMLKQEWGAAKKPKLFKTWGEIGDKTNRDPNYSYQALKLSLRKRINKLTSSIILSSIYIDKSDDIIQKYSGANGPGREPPRRRRLFFGRR